MRIVYLMDQMYLHGGAEKIISLKLNSLSNESKYEVYLLTTEQKSKSPVYNISENINWIDLKINYNRSKSYFLPQNLLKSIKHYFSLKKEIKKIQPDVIISVSQSPDQFFLPFIEKSIPKIKEFHSSGFNLSKPISFFDKLKYKLFLLYEKYNALVVLNQDEKKYYPFSNLEVIPNFILEKKNKINKSYQDRKNVIIAAGRIAEVKQFDHLIDSWKDLYFKFPNWEVHIYGEGDEFLKKKLEKKVKKNSIKNLYFKGATLQLDEKMRDGAIYAMTSSTECFPMVLLEAMSNGLPVISYDCPNGPRNIITENEDGLLVEVNNIEAFSKGLEKLITDDKLRSNMSTEGLKNSNYFLNTVIIQDWKNLFYKITK